MPLLPKSHDANNTIIDNGNKIEGMDGITINGFLHQR
jgi:hypothetical protein